MTKRLLTALFAALWLLDATGTILFVSLHGPEAEANPLMRWLIATQGLAVFGLVKAATLAGWLAVSDRAHVAIHWGLLALMVPAVVLGHAMGVA